MSLVKMPPELLANICFSLPLSSIAALEGTCSDLRRGIGFSGIFNASFKNVESCQIL